MKVSSKYDVKVGADPELFLKRGTIFQSAYGVIPGTKHDPFKVPNGAIQVDGMALEFNIDPADSKEEFGNNVGHVLSTLRNMVPMDFDLEISPVAEFDPEYMENQPEEAKMLGCDPDFDAYLEQANPAPDQHPTMRTAAGHVHIGWGKGFDVNDFEHFMACCGMAKCMDYYLGLIGVIHDPDKKRKEMYGRAGCFRPKPYGMEYRTLSNFWLKSKELIDLVYDNTIAGFTRLAVDGNHPFNYYGTSAKEYINGNDINNARKLCEMMNIRYQI